MARHRLENSGWGFETNCFVCEESNDAGLRLAFFHDDEADEVLAEFTLGEAFSGAPAFVHGGVSLAILDEAMAWAGIALGGKWAVTSGFEAAFERPVRVGERYRVTARLVDATDDVIAARGEIVDLANGKVRVRATASLTPVGEAYAVNAGAPVSEQDRGYLKG